MNRARLIKLGDAVLGETWGRAILLACALFVALMGIAVGLWHISQRIAAVYLLLVLLSVLALNIAIPILERKHRRAHHE